MGEAVVFKCPYTYQDGGKIMGRFGTPSGHHFGIDASASAFTGGVHNVWYTAKSQALSGVESISLFVNSQDGKSQAYEFALSLKEQGSAGDPGDDTVFSTKSVHATCSSRRRHKVVRVLSAMVYFWLCLAVMAQAWKLQTFLAIPSPSNMAPVTWSSHRLVVARQCMTRSSEW